MSEEIVLAKFGRIMSEKYHVRELCHSSGVGGGGGVGPGLFHCGTNCLEFLI